MGGPRRGRRLRGGGERGEEEGQQREGEAASHFGVPGFIYCLSLRAKRSNLAQQVVCWPRLLRRHASRGCPPCAFICCRSRVTPRSVAPRNDRSCDIAPQI